MLSSQGKTRFTIFFQVRPDAPHSPYAWEELANLTWPRVELLEGLLEAVEEGAGGSAREPAKDSRAKGSEAGGERAEASALLSDRDPKALRLRDVGEGVEASALTPAKASLVNAPRSW